MDDSISRQAAIDALKDMYKTAEKWGEEASDDVIKARAESCMASLIEMKMRIEKLPSADRPIGKWEEKEVIDKEEASKVIDEWQSASCSCCGKYNTTPYSYYFTHYNYCPNCGAEMREEKRR